MKIARRLVRIGSYLLPFRIASQAARFFLATQGIGYATDVEDSGELIAAQRLTPPDGIVFDIGANTGLFAAGLLTSQRTFHLFEPSPAHFAELKKRFSSVNVKLKMVGLSDAPSVLTLHKDQQISGLASFIDRDLKWIRTELSIHETVPVITGDQYCAENGITLIDYMKIDVEGWEMPVLNGFGKMFAEKRVRACQFEFAQAHVERRENFRDFYRWFTDRGYTMHIIKPSGSLNSISAYEGLYENYYASNYLARSA
jgi:FkbM family methyltransferase